MLGLRMQTRIKRQVGRKVESEAELTSLGTWMKIEDAEEKRKSGAADPQ
jgi:hypothetical protein